jgi:hypothetical protein
MSFVGHALSVPVEQLAAIIPFYMERHAGKLRDRVGTGEFTDTVVGRRR